MTTTNRGFAFSLDLAFSSILIFAMLFLATFYFSAESESTLESVRGFGLQKNALFVADSIVKNRSENWLLGAAAFDEKKRRVMGNQLDFGRIAPGAKIESSEFFVKEVFVSFRDGGVKTVSISNADAESCISVERVVTIEHEIALLGVVACEK